MTDPFTWRDVVLAVIAAVGTTVVIVGFCLWAAETLHDGLHRGRRR